MMIVRKPDPTWLKLSADADFQAFIRGYLQLLKENLQRVTVMDQRGNAWHSYYICGQDHDRRNPNWKPFRLLNQYCRKQGLDDYETREMIEDRIGRRLVCECELVGGPTG
jgi:hypothetical protein